MISLKSLESLFSAVKNHTNIIWTKINKILQQFTTGLLQNVKNDYF